MEYTHFGRKLMVRIPAGERDSPLFHTVQTGYGAHPAHSTDTGLSVSPEVEQP